MLSLILGFITGLAGPISAVINNITDLKKMKVKADSDVERAEIGRQIEEAHDKQAVLVTQAASRLGALVLFAIQIVFSIPAAAFLYKRLMWDNVIGSLDGCAGKISSKAIQEYCNRWYFTDSIDANSWWYILAVVSFWFVTSYARKMIK